MNNDETMIMQPQQAGASEQNTANNAGEAKNVKTGSTGKRVAATAVAGVAGGVMGGVASMAAENIINAENAEEPEVQTEENASAAQPAHEAKAEATPAPAVEAKEEVLVAGNNGEEDYTGHGGADPVVTTPVSQPTGGDEGGSEVRVLGIYGNDEGQELAVLTDGETVAAVFDANGDGEANFIAVDENHNEKFDEGEIHDISDRHIGMNRFEDAYIAQQQEEQVSQETFAYNASDELDYNNDAEVYDA